MTRRRPALMIASAGLAALALAGCTSSGTAPGGPTSSPSSAPVASPSSLSASASSAGSVGLRLGQAPALLIQCGLDSGTIKPPTSQPWLAGKRVLPLTGPGSDNHGAELSTWWDANKTTVVGGQPLSYWQTWSAQHDALPAQVCGTSVSASALLAKIAPGQTNAWGS